MYVLPLRVQYPCCYCYCYGSIVNSNLLSVHNIGYGYQYTHAQTHTDIHTRTHANGKIAQWNCNKCAVVFFCDSVPSSYESVISSTRLLFAIRSTFLCCSLNTSMTQNHKLLFYTGMNQISSTMNIVLSKLIWFDLILFCLLFLFFRFRKFFDKRFYDDDLEAVTSH